MSNSAQDDDHLDTIEDGAGCTEIWEKLSEHREQTDSQSESDDD